MAQIQEAILLGHLVPGSRLASERELANQLGVGRSSVREALRTLETLGALTVQPGTGPESGAIVSGHGANGLGNLLSLYTTLRQVPVRDLVELRIALEPCGARGAARDPRTAGLVLGDILAEMVRAEQPESFLQVDTDFHVSIAKLSGNSVAPLFMEALRESMNRQMLRAFQRLADWPLERGILMHEHTEIAKRIGSGDGPGAAEALVQHVRDFYGRVLSEE